MDNRRVLKNRMSALKDCEPWEMWSWGDFIEAIGIDRSSNWEDTVDRVCRLIGGDPEREAAADWVEVNGGLDEVSGKLDAYDAIDDERGYLMELRAEVSARLGIGLDGIAPAEAHARIIGELDKRLMPEGMEWPRFEDGEKVKFGDEFAWGIGKRKCTATKLGSEGFALLDKSIGNSAWHGYSYTERVKRPEPEVLAADGLPIEVGQTVYAEFSGSPLVVEKIEGAYLLDAGGTMLRADCATHTPPDTQERIAEDEKKHKWNYWGCLDGNCNECPSKIDGKNPRERYGVDNCSDAKIIDLYERLRKLDGRTMGGAK